MILIYIIFSFLFIFMCHVCIEYFYENKLKKELEVITPEQDLKTFFNEIDLKQ
jgi:hypothetical protein